MVRDLMKERYGDTDPITRYRSMVQQADKVVKGIEQMRSDQKTVLELIASNIKAAIDCMERKDYGAAQAILNNTVDTITK